jgi:uncharacterized ferritin-like protein (DUF455 family)
VSARSVHDAAGDALAARSMDDKSALVRAAREAWLAGELSAGGGGRVLDPWERGRPEWPELVEPRELRARSLRTREGHVAAVHAVAHIEANAVDLALDAVHRFRDLPSDFHDDWLRVADEEAHHFELLRARLRALGADYGDLPAHGRLWDACAATADDPLARMALVPRVLEARGLDVTPAMRARFADAGDHETAEVLDVILRDEVGHVAVGNRWFRWLCAEQGVEPAPTFARLLADAGVRVRPPLNLDARLAAGFTEAELATLGAPAQPTASGTSSPSATR